MSPQDEIRYRRPLTYSLWHRKALPPHCYMSDGDWFELRIRNGEMKIVAYFETIELPVMRSIDQLPLWDITKGVALAVSKQFHIPVYIVWYNQACTTFIVESLPSNLRQKFSEEEYISFLKRF